MVTTHLVVLSFFDGASTASVSSGTSFGGHLTVPPYYLFDGFGGTVSTPTPDAPVGGGKSKRKRERLAAKIDGKLQFFDSIEELEGYLASLSEEKIEKAEVKARKAYAGVIVKTGDVPPKPKIVVSRASGEVLEAVNRANEMLALQYMQILLELKQQEDDEDDLLLL